MIYFNKDDKLMAVEIDDPIKIEQFRSWLRKTTNRFEARDSGYGTINIKLNNLVITNNRKKHGKNCICIT